MGKKPECEEYAHKWTVWEQGGTIIANGTIPGIKCICGKKILIEKYCPRCTHRSIRAVKTNSQEAKDYLNGK